MGAGRVYLQNRPSWSLTTCAAAGGGSQSSGHLEKSRIQAAALPHSATGSEFRRKSAAEEPRPAEKVAAFDSAAAAGLFLGPDWTHVSLGGDPPHWTEEEEGGVKGLYILNEPQS